MTILSWHTETKVLNVYRIEWQSLKVNINNNFVGMLMKRRSGFELQKIW